jgi:hypothetical protein
MKNNRKVYRDKWWHYAEKRPDLQKAVAGMERVLVTAQTSRMWEPDYVRHGVVCSHSTIIFRMFSYSSFACMQAVFHEIWRLEYGPSLRSDARYTPSDCFETFPFPLVQNALETIGEHYHSHRRQTTLARQEGLTKTYNRFHNPNEPSADIQKLRDLHVEMDNAVAAAYGWTDLNLDHGFHETKQGIRFTISEPARREVLQRLLKLNHERYAEEVKQGLHGKKGGAGRVAGGGKSAGVGGKKTGGGAKGAAKKSDATGSKKSRGLFDEEGDA